MDNNILEEIRVKAVIVRSHIIKMIGRAGSGHPGGALSSADLMTMLYFHFLRHDPKNPTWEDRDRVIFSKGHSSALLYACLAESGYFPQNELETFRELGSRLQGHPSRIKKLPGVEISTGSLGQGLSVGVGMALALKLSRNDARVYVLIGCGECDCGQIWEAAMSASHYNLDNLCGIIDYNKLQIDGTTNNVMGLEPFIEKWHSFGWVTIEINGHDLKAILDAYNKASHTKGKPTAIIAHSIKGKGVSFMENEAGWHGKAPNEEQIKMALKELSLQ